MNQQRRQAPAPQNELVLWYKSLSAVTRFLFSATVLFTVAGTLINPFLFIMQWDRVLWELQIWRLLTCFFLHSPNLNFLFDLAFFYRCSKDLEERSFFGRTADYGWFVTAVMGMLLLLDYNFNFFVLGQALIMAVGYLWALQNADMMVSFMFGARFKAIYLPWALLLLHFVSSNGRVPYDELAGIACAHLYHFLEKVYPQMNPTAPRYMATPRWFADFFGDAPRVAGFATEGSGIRVVDASRGGTGTSTSFGGHRWGAGRPLGSG